MGNTLTFPKLMMSLPEFRSQQEFEAYLAQQNARTESRIKQSTRDWKIVYIVTAAIALGIALLFSYPNTEIGQSKKKENQNQFFESVLTWVGFDVNRFEREHNRRIENLSHIEPPVMPELPVVEYNFY